jgi:hypothetical protein
MYFVDREDEAFKAPVEITPRWRPAVLSGGQTQSPVSNQKIGDGALPPCKKSSVLKYR